jgi:hypothetical protein
MGKATGLMIGVANGTAELGYSLRLVETMDFFL